MGTERAGAEHRLAALLVSPAFEQIHARLAAFNPFSILRITDHEIRHSNVLAWLLNPTANHGLRETFLRRFLLDAVQRNEHLLDGFPVLDVARHSLADAEVMREVDHIDVLIRIPSLRLTCAIENKVHAGESPGQLQRYRQACAARYPDDMRMHLLLTLEDDQPSDQEYGRYSHRHVLQILKQCLDQAGTTVPNQARDFINYYIETIQVLVMDDAKLQQICREIYRDHREAIDLIMRYCSGSGWSTACETFVREHDVECLYQNSGSLWFLPNDLFQRLPRIGTSDWTSQQVPIAMWFNWTNRDRFGIVIEVGPLVDPALRIRLLTHLRTQGFSFNSTGLTETAKYTRIARLYRDFGDWENSDSVAQEMHALYQGLEPDVAQLRQALSSFAWTV